jgi:hypothetical protein
MSNNVRVILLARSYNDLDCRLPLLHEFQDKYGFSASILIIPTISSSGLTVKHPLPEKIDIPVEYLVTKLTSRFAGYLIACASRLIERSRLKVLRYRVWSRLWLAIHYCLSLDKSLRQRFCALTEKAIVIGDDILATPERSLVVPWIVAHPSARLYCLSHGQNTYLNLWHDLPKKAAKSIGYSLRIFSPSENDRRILQTQHRDAEVITIGNTRFDIDWVRNTQEQSSGRGAAVLLEPFDGTKIGFMMSKMEYGLEASNVLSLINQIASRNDTKLVLKPHTRGMSLDDYKSQIADGVIVGNNVPSSEIIDWADIIIFTGSSIIFEAMIKRKRVLFLAALQKYQTIFDELPPIAVFQAGADVGEAISRLEHEAYDYDAIDEFLASHTHNHIPGGRVCAAFAERVISELATEV